jgi:lipopolysaccharide export system permease protein
MTARVLDFYIARRFVATLALILFALCTVIFLAEYVETLRRYSDEASFTALVGARLALMRLPFLFDTALPFAFLFAALLSLLGLSRKLELVVARASGVSVWGFLRAPAAVALVLGAFATGLLNPIAVGFQEKAENMRAELTGRAAWGGGHWFRQESDAGPSIIYAGSADIGSLTLFGVTAFVFDNAGKFREKVGAPSAKFGDTRWTLPDATAFSAAAAPHLATEYELPTELTANEVRRSIIEPETISVWSLPGVIASAGRMGLDPNRFRVEFHTLLSRPIFLLAMVLIAATVSLRLTRSGGTWRLLLTGAAIGFLLYAFGEIAGDLGANGIIDPVLAAWLPPAVALTFGATTLLFLEDG